MDINGLHTRKRNMGLTCLTSHVVFNRSVIVAGVLALCFSPCKASTAQSTTLPSITLSDQFGKEYSSSDLAGFPVILFLADRKGSGHSKEWGLELEAEFERLSIPVQFLAVADLTGSPYLLRPIIRSHIRRKHPTPVLLDWKGSLKHDLKTADKTVNIYVFNGRQELVFTTHETIMQAHIVVQIVDIVQSLLQ